MIPTKQLGVVSTIKSLQILSPSLFTHLLRSKDRKTDSAIEKLIFSLKYGEKQVEIAYESFLSSKSQKVPNKDV